MYYFFYMKKDKILQKDLNSILTNDRIKITKFEDFLIFDNLSENNYNTTKYETPDIKKIYKKNLKVKIKKIKKIKSENNILTHTLNFGIDNNNNENFSGYIELEYRKSENCNTFLGDKFIENNKDKCIIEINDKYISINEFLNTYNSKNIPLNLKILFKSTINDLSYMFYNCTSLKKINMFFLDSAYDNITDLSYMFYNCGSLIEIPDLSIIDFSKMKNIDYMFYNCKSLTKFPDIYKFNFNENISSKNIFNNCKNIDDLFLTIFLQKLNINISDIINSNFKTIIKENYDKIITYLKSLHIEQIWKFLIPRQLHKYGKDIFEKKNDILKNKEKGYLQSMYNGWKYIFEIKNDVKIDKNIYEELHNIVIKNVKKLKKNATKYRVNKSKIFLTSNFDNYDKLNKERDILIKNLWGDKYYINYKFYNNKKKCFSIFTNFEKSEAYRKIKKNDITNYSEIILQLIINTYYQKKDELIECKYIEDFKQNININDEINNKYNILTSTNKLRKCKKNKIYTRSLLSDKSSYEDKLLEIIVTTCKLIMESYIFYDGNKRTISLLLNILLKENKMLPTILEDPLILLKNTIPEIINKIKEGQYYSIKSLLLT